MIKLKKKVVLLSLLLLIFFIFGIYTIQNPEIITNLISGKAVKQSISLNVTISGPYYEQVVADATGTVLPTDSNVNQIIYQVTSLQVGSTATTLVYATSKPSGFADPPSEASEIFNYATITLDTQPTGTATIFFKVSQANLGSTNPNRIYLYQYADGSWNRLTTTIIDSVSDPATFSAPTTSFSNFFIGIGPVPSVAPTPPSAGTPSSRAGKPLEIPKKPGKPLEIPSPKPIEKIPKPVLEKIPEAIKEFFRYTINYITIYISTIIIIIVAILLAILYYFIYQKNLKDKQKK